LTAVCCRCRCWYPVTKIMEVNVQGPIVSVVLFYCFLTLLCTWYRLRSLCKAFLRQVKTIFRLFNLSSIRFKCGEHGVLFNKEKVVPYAGSCDSADSPNALAQQANGRTIRGHRAHIQNGLAAVVSTWVHPSVFYDSPLTRSKMTNLVLLTTSISIPVFTRLPNDIPSLLGKFPPGDNFWPNAQKSPCSPTLFPCSRSYLPSACNTET
jgi:hypothetical protein